MNHLGFEDFVRLLNLLLILIWFITAFRLRVWWKNNTKESQIILLIIPSFLVVLAYSTIEAILLDVGSGLRVFLYTPVCSLAIFTNIQVYSRLKEEEHILRKLDERLSRKL